MKIKECKNAPAWLVEAHTENADVEISAFGAVIWHSGVWRGGDWRGGDWHGGDWHGGDWRGGDWRGGDWRGGDWHGGVWRGGDWHGGDWRDGDWHSGVWHGGVWHGGVWHGGVWHGGVWHGGVWHGGIWRGGVWQSGVWRGGDWHGGDWHGGVWHGGDWHSGVWDGGDWHGGENRLLYMAASIGILFDADDTAIAYRSTQADGKGRHTKDFLQPEGEYREDNLPAAGSGTCVKGIHVSSAAIAYSYFGVDPTAQLWRVRFKREDLLDCDGQKARIRGGVFERIAWPFLKTGLEVNGNVE